MVIDMAKYKLLEAVYSGTFEWCHDLMSLEKRDLQNKGQTHSQQEAAECLLNMIDTTH